MNWLLFIQLFMSFLSLRMLVLERDYMGDTKRLMRVAWFLYALTIILWCL